MRRFKIQIICAVAFICAGVFGVVHAQGPGSIEYPIPELGNCASEEECRRYCEAPEHHEACVSFAVEAGLMPPEVLEQVRRAKQLREHVQEFEGPGGCSSEEECEAYCEEPSHRDECFQFALDQGFITEEDRAMMHQIEEGHREFEAEMEEHTGIDRDKARRLITEIGGPGGCSSMNECEAFCSEESNARVCMEYAREHGLIRAEDAAKMEKQIEIMQKMESGELNGPGGCSTHAECETYCSDPSHMDECTDFAVEMGMMSEEQAARMQEFRERGEEIRRQMEERRERMRAEFEEKREQFQEFGFPPEGGDHPEDFDEGPPPEGFEPMMPPEGFKVPSPEEVERYREKFEQRFEDQEFEYEYEEEHEREPVSGSLLQQLSTVIAPFANGLGL